MMRYATIGALCLVVAAMGFAWWQHARASRLALLVDALTAELETSGARIKNSKEAIGDVEKVDTWGGLNVVPDYWLFPESPPGD